MTKQQIQFIKDNQVHMDLVLISNQNFQPSHDIAKEVIAIANTLDKYKDNPVTNCTGCIQQAYQDVWNEFLLTQKKAK